MDAEAQWARGMVHLPESDQTNDNEWLGTDICFGQDNWDDSLILDIFDDAIRSHKTKKGKSAVAPSEKKVSKKPKSASDSKIDAESATPGSWRPVSINGKNEGGENRVAEDPHEPRDIGYESSRNNNSNFKQYLSNSQGEVNGRDKESEIPRSQQSGVPRDNRAPNPNNERAPSSSSTGTPGYEVNYGYRQHYNQQDSEQGNHQGNQQYNQQSDHQERSPNPNPNPDAEVSELEDSFNGMLMAWYQSGYATGRYQTLLELSKNKNNNQSPNPPPSFPPYPGGRGESQQGRR